MALQRGKLADIAELAVTAGSVLANPAATITYVRAITLFNHDTVARVVKLYNVPDSTGALGTAAAANQFAEISLSAGETVIFEWDYPIVLEDTNDSIQGEAAAANTVTIMLHGDQDA